MRGGNEHVRRFWKSRRNRHQDPLWFDGGSDGQVGDRHHTRADHLERDRIGYIRDYQCTTRWMALENGVDVGPIKLIEATV